MPDASRELTQVRDVVVGGRFKLPDRGLVVRVESRSDNEGGTQTLQPDNVLKVIRATCRFASQFVLAFHFHGKPLHLRFWDAVRQNTVAFSRELSAPPPQFAYVSLIAAIGFKWNLIFSLLGAQCSAVVKVIRILRILNSSAAMANRSSRVPGSPAVSPTMVAGSHFVFRRGAIPDSRYNCMHTVDCCPVHYSRTRFTATSSLSSSVALMNQCRVQKYELRTPNTGPGERQHIRCCQ